MIGRTVAGFADVLGQVVQLELRDRLRLDRQLVLLPDVAELLDLRSIEEGEQFPVPVAQRDLGPAAGDMELPVQGLVSIDRLAVEQGRNTAAVEVVVGRKRCLRHITDARQHVETTDGHVAGRARLHMTGPTNDSRHADTALVQMPFLFSKRAAGSVRVIAGDGRAVVTGEQHQRAVGQVVLIESGQQTAEGVVHLGDVGVVADLGPLLEIRVKTLEDLGRRDRFVRFVETDEQEEWLVLVASRVVGWVEPIEGFVDDQLTGIAFQRSDGLAVADKVVGVAMAGQGVVLRAEPVIEAVIRGLRLFGQVEAAVEMPFANVAGVVAGLLEEFRERDFVASQVHGREQGDPVVDAGPIGGPAGQQAGSGGAAVGRSGVAAGQSQATGGEAVDMRRLDGRAAVAGQVAITEVVAQHDHDVGPGCGRLGPALRDHEYRSDDVWNCASHEAGP